MRMADAQAGRPAGDAGSFKLTSGAGNCCETIDDFVSDGDVPRTRPSRSKALGMGTVVDGDVLDVGLPTGTRKPKALLLPPISAINVRSSTDTPRQLGAVVAQAVIVEGLR